MSFIQQFTKYSAVGGVGAFIHFTTLYVLTDHFGVWYMISSIIAAGIAMCFNFVGNKFWTFKPARTIVSADYDWNAYFHGNSIQKWWKRRLATLVIKYASVDNPVYDIGCGSSPILSLISVKEKHGVELNADKVAFMRDKDRTSEYRVGSALDTGLPDECASVVVCVEVIEHIDKPHLLMKELTRIAKRNGRIIIATPDFASWRWNVTELLYGLLMTNGYHCEHNVKFTESSLRALGEAHGLDWLCTEKVFGADMVVVFRKHQ